MTTKVFLDLEETIIDSWDNPLLMNVEKIRTALKEIGVTEVGIFSFAIWHDQDKIDFHNRGIASAIEAALNVKIGPVLTIPDIAKEIFWKSGMQMEVTEFITLWGKQRAFIDWALIQRTHNKNEEMTIVLIDDVVRNISVIDRDRNLTINLINVLDL